MTVSSTDRTAGPFNGSGIETAFPFTFRVFTAADLLVTLTDPTGVAAVLTLGADYTVSLNADQSSNPGGTVTKLVALASGYTLDLTSNVSALQPARLTTAGGFRPEVIEDALDRQIVVIQQQGLFGTQSIRTPESTGLSPLPAATGRALRMASFDSTGDADVTPFTVTEVAAAIEAAGLSGVAAGRFASSELVTVAAGTTTVFFASVRYTAGVSSVFIIIEGGGFLIPGLDFTENVAGDRITLAAPFPSTTKLFVIGGRIVSTGVAALDVSVGVGRYTRALEDWAGDTFNVFDDMTAEQRADVKAGTALIDVSSSIQYTIDRALDLANSASERGVTIYFPQGIYWIGTQLVVDESRVALVGDGPSMSVLITKSNTNASILKVEASGGAAVLEIVIKGLKFEGRGSNATAGRLLDLNNVIGGWFYDLKVDNWYDGIYVQGCNRCYFDKLILSQNGRASGAGRWAMPMIGNSVANLSSDVHVSRIQVLSNSTQRFEAAMVLRGIDGVYVDSFHFVDGDYGLKISPTTAAGQNTCSSLQMTNGYFDRTYVGAHIDFEGETTGPYRDFRFYNVLCRESANDGLHFANLGTAPDLIRFDGTIRSCAGSGIKVDETVFPPTNVVVNATLSDNNTGAGAADGDAIIRGTGWVLDLQCNEGDAAGYAIDLRTEAVDCRVKYADLRRSTAGTKIRDLGTGNRLGIIDGFVIRNRGSVTLTNPATSVVVTHGCDKTPAANQIHVHLNYNAGGSWVTSITSTQFTINVATSPAVSSSVGWSVDMQD